MALAVVSLLWLSGELYTTKGGLEHQLRTGGVYGRTIFADDHHYKVLLYGRRRPLVLALGSSRTMQFRETYLDPSQRFMTAGGAMHTLEEGDRFVTETFPTWRPQVVILGVDYWWFQPAAATAETTADDARYDSYSYVLAAGASALPRLVPHLLARVDVAAPFSGIGAVGSRGRTFGDGFRTDGSHAAAGFYSHGVGDPGVLDVDYQYTLGRIRNETHPFEGGGHVSAEATAVFRRLLARLASQGTKVALFLPPFSPPVYQALAGSPRYAILGEVRRLVAATAVEQGMKFGDYSSMPFPDRSCYTDGFHGSEQLYALIARELIDPARTDRSRMDVVLPHPGSPCSLLENLSK